MKLTRYAVFLFATVAAFPQCTADKPELKKTLIDAKVVNVDRILTHCSHTCDLEFAGDPYHVLDVRELVKNVSVPRGVNHIVILNSAWKVSKTVSYADQRPLFCRGDELFVFGKLHVPESVGDAGNVIVFRGPELDVEFLNVDWISLPTLREQDKPAAKSRK
jgi:hypothetical protein